jgi:hypothetical protein
MRNNATDVEAVMTRILFGLMLMAGSAHAADYAVVLSDVERAALLDALDVATKAKGLEIAGNTVYLANKIKSAPVVTAQKDEPPPAPAPAPQ